MSAITDKARDFWDRISPRERRLVLIAAIAAPITIAIWLGLNIKDGLDAMEYRNSRTRKALDVLSDLRARGETHPQADDVLSGMPSDPISLPTYLDKAAQKAKFTLKSAQPHTPVERNGFVTNSVSVSLDDLSIDQVKDFLQAVETDSKYVAITHLSLSRDFRNKDKLDAQLEVSTYSKPKPKAEGSGSDAAAGSDKKGG